MSDYGINITQPGYEALDTNVSKRKLAASSPLNNLKIAKEGLIEDQLSDSVFSFSENISHNLGYKPIVRAYIWDEDRDYWSITPVIDTSTWTILGNWNHVDVNTVQFYAEASIFDAPPSAKDVKIKYFILVEPREDAWYE